MADNLILNPTSGGSTVKTDEIAGVHIPVSKIALGNDGDDDGYVSGTNPLPVSDAGLTLSIDDGAGSITVDGAVTVTNATAANLLTRTDASYAEDAAHASGDRGHFVLGVRNDTASTTFGADGDYSPIAVDANGRVGISDLGGAISVDDNSSSLTVDGTVAATQSGTWNVTNVSGTVSLPTGASTLTEQQSQTTHLATIAGDTTDIEAAVELIDDTVFAEDVAAQAGDKGISVLAVRRDTASTMVGADNDYTNLIVDSSGRLHVNVGNTVTVGSHAVTNAGTFVTQENGAALTALQVIDNPVVVDDAAFTPATTSVMMAGFEFDDVSPDSVNEGDAGAARMSANRSIYTQIRDAAGNERGVNVDASNRLSVSVDNTVTVSSHAVTNDGTFVVQENGAALTSLQLIDDTVYAEDAASANGDKGIMVLARRTAAPANTSGTDLDYESLQMSAGRLWTSATIDAALPAGANAIGTLAANSGVDIGDVTINNASGASAVNIQDGGNSITVDLAAASTYRSDALTNTALAVNASATNLLGYHIINLNALPSFVHLYNVASGSVTVGTTTPKMTLYVPANGAIEAYFTVPIACNTALTMAATTGITGSAAPSSNLLANVIYT